METGEHQKHPIMKHLCAAMLALVGFFVAQLLVSVAGLAVYILSKPGLLNMPYEMILDDVTGFLLSHQCLILILSDLLFLGILALILHKKGSSLFREIHLSRFSPLRFVLFLCAGFVVNMLISLLLGSIPFPESWVSGYNSTVEILTRESFPLQLLAIAVLGPVAEEVVFRGMIYLHFKRIMPKVLAIILESLIFGLFHQLQPIWMLYSFLMGLVLTVLMEKTDNIAYPIAVHIGFNLIGLF